MKNENKTGRNSLVISLIGLVSIQILLYFKLIDGYWHILLSGFEAATVGGFADWFAVKALFREIPIPFIRRHTNIIVKNREKISNGIVDLVTNEWLSPEVIREKISGIAFTDKIISSVQSKNINLDGVLKPVVSQLLDTVDLNVVLHKQIDKLDLGMYLGDFLNKFLDSSAYTQLMIKLFEIADGAINSQKTLTLLESAIEQQLVNYKDESLVKNLLVSVGKGANAIDKKSIAKKLLDAIHQLIVDSKNNPDAVLRIQLDFKLKEFSQNLLNGSDETNEIVLNLKNELKKLDVTKLVSNVKEFSNISGIVDDIVTKLDTDSSLKLKLDSFILNTIEKMIVSNHNQIGSVVEDSLNKLDNEELVSQIEGKVGDDLQYIRLNGAIVGGFVGIVIATIRHFLL